MAIDLETETSTNDRSSALERGSVGWENASAFFNSNNRRKTQSVPAVPRQAGLAVILTHPSTLSLFVWTDMSNIRCHLTEIYGIVKLTV